MIRHGDSIPERVFQSLQRSKIRVRNQDIIAVASKVVATAEGRVIPLGKRPSAKASRLARRYKMFGPMVQVVLDEADEVYGGVKGALLTLKDGDAVPNSGVDQKNAPPGSAVLWPSDSTVSAKRILDFFRRKLGKRIGVVIVDSRVTPLRLGTIGMALACAGFKPTLSFKQKRDLFGRRPRITVQARADGIAAAAHLLMGEGKERVPFVLVRKAPVDFSRSGPIPKLERSDCLYMSCLCKRSRTTRL